MRAKIDNVLGQALWIIMAIMVVNVLWQVISRFILQSPSSFTDELARYLMIWIGVLGAAYVAGKQMHIAIDIIPSRSKEETRSALKMIVYALVILFAFFGLFIGGSRLVYISFFLGQKSPALQLPLGFVYMVIPISGLLIIYYKIDDLLNVSHD